MAEQRGNIAEFNAGDGPALDVSKQNEAANNISRAAITEGNLYRQAGQDYKQAGKDLGEAVTQHQFMNEVSTGAPASAALTNNKLQEWQQAATQPGATNDPDFQKNWMDNNLEPALQQWQNGFSTQKGQEWAQTHADMIRTEFYHTTSADMMKLTAEQRMQDITTFANQQGAMVAKDPALADFAMKNIDSHAEALRQDPAFQSVEGQIAAKKLIADQKNEVAMVQVKAFADKGNMAAANKALEAQGAAGFIKPNEEENLKGYIANQRIAHELQAQQQRDQQKYKDQQVNEKTTHDIFSDIASGKVVSATTAFSAKGLSPQQRTDLISPDKSNPGILNLPRKFLTSPEYGPGFASTAEAIQRGEEVTPAGLTKGIRMYGNPETTNQAITPAGAARLQEIQDKMKTPAGAMEVQAQNNVLNALQSQFIPGGVYAKDQKGQQLYAGIQTSFYTMWDKEIQAGKTPAQLSDPDGKDYIGNAFLPLKRSPAQVLSDAANSKPDTDHLTQLQEAQQKKNAPAIKSKDDFDKLKAGAYYMRDGQLYQKPAEK